MNRYLRILVCMLALVGAASFVQAAPDKEKDKGKAAEKSEAKDKKSDKAKAGECDGHSILGKADADKDGALTMAEANAQRAQWFKEMDANKDGKLSASEYPGESFKKIDKNGDGVVVIEEWLIYFVGNASDKKAANTGAPQKGHWAAGADSNKDGKISRDEFAAVFVARFYYFDANKDGKVSTEEFKAGHEKLMKDMDTNKDGSLSVDEFAGLPGTP